MNVRSVAKDFPVVCVGDSAGGTVDVQPYTVMLADPQVGRFFMDGLPLARSEAWRQMAMSSGHWVLRGYGLWAVEERATGRFIGRIGCLESEGVPAFEIACLVA